MRCPKCNNHLLQRSGKRTRLRAKGPLIFEEGECRTQCYWCGVMVVVPVRLNEAQPVHQEQFLLKR